MLESFANIRLKLIPQMMNGVFAGESEDFWGEGPAVRMIGRVKSVEKAVISIRFSPSFLAGISSQAAPALSELNDIELCPRRPSPASNDLLLFVPFLW